jgi:hypothetical protein
MNRLVLIIILAMMTAACVNEYIPANEPDDVDMSIGQCVTADDCEVNPNKQCFGDNASVTYAAYARCLEGEDGNYCKFYDSPLLNCPNGCDPMTGLCKDK